MVKLFLEEINKGLYQDYMMDEDEVSSLLKFLEDKGMLPPKRMKVEHLYCDHSWEPEQS